MDSAATTAKGRRGAEKFKTMQSYEWKKKNAQIVQNQLCILFRTVLFYRVFQLICGICETLNEIQ